MKQSIACLVAVVAATETNEVAFMRYVTEHNKSYGTREEFQFRMKLFLEKDAEINRINEEYDTFEVGHNKFSDWTHEEFKRLLGAKVTTNDLAQYNPVRLENNDVAPRIDWREYGAVTEVKNQGACGSCWSFGSTGAIEGAYWRKHQQLASFSEQQLVDCTRSLGNGGCNGGLQDTSFTYAKTNPLTTEAEYPYTATEGQCQSVTGYAAVSDFHHIEPNSWGQLMVALNIQPITLNIEADKPIFQHYKTGVITGSECGTALDHAVLAIGYGNDTGIPYFLIKNSWSTDWGEQGFAKIAMEDGPGVCGIQSYMLYPDVL